MRRCRSTARRDQLRLGDALKTGRYLEIPYDLLSILESDSREDLLTPRQREVLEAAVRNGYFEVPRECTLAELPEELEVDKSTASGILRRGEAQIVTWFLTGAGKGRLE